MNLSALIAGLDGDDELSAEEVNDLTNSFADSVLRVAGLWLILVEDRGCRGALHGLRDPIGHAAQDFTAESREAVRDRRVVGRVRCRGR